MTSRSTPDRPAPRAIAWRRQLLRSAGLGEELARALARSNAHDVHGLIGLVGSGCPVATALRITAHAERAA